MGNWWSANKHWIEQTHDSSVASTSTSGTLSTSGISSTQNLTCEVFLSFRGPDTRHGFISHLYEGLKRQGIDAFRDEENLEKGFEIHPYLKAAIEKSQYAVVIISERFAESKSCLIELNEIMERERKGCIKVFPVFYHVEPFDVRHLKGKFGEHFTQFRKEVGSKVDTAEWEKWAGTLKEVGKLNGWHVQNRDEAYIVQEISLKILYGLVAKPKEISELLFGIETPLKDIMNLLSLESSGVRFIGICGIGGIGKSSLARVIRARASPKFCASCMIDVGRGGFFKLGKQLIHKLLSPEVAKLLKTEDEVSAALESRLTNRKVLIVLDDLHEGEKLKALTNPKWFGDGSRIIITSRDRKWPCLDKDSIYDVRTLTDRAALQLFCSNAFPKGGPIEEFWELIEELVNLAKGLPLALEFYGSHVKGEAKGYWESYRDELKENLDQHVKRNLQITFDRMKGQGQLRDAFLDILCFLKDGQGIFYGDRPHRDYLHEKLVLLGYSSNILRDLESKSLLKYVKNDMMFEEGKLFIHDLLVQMGQEIADQERLWRHQDIVSTLQGNPGKFEIDKLKVLQLQENYFHTRLFSRAFKKMKNLRMVLIHDWPFEWFGEYSDLKPSNELRFLHWYKYPFKSLPAGFNPTNLIKLRLPYSCIDRLWDGNGYFPKLKDINLTGSKALKEIPDLSLVPSLEILDFSYCTNLHLVHPSIGLLKHLKELNFEDCRSLERIPDKITSNSLKVLKLRGCSKLKGLSNEIHSKTLECLDLYGCSKIKNLPAILGEIQSLQYIDISQVTMEEFPFSFRRLRSLKEFVAKATRIAKFVVDITFLEEKKDLSVQFHDLYTSLGLPPLSLSSLKCQILHGCIPSYEAESSDLSSCCDGHNKFLEALSSNLKYLLDVSLRNCNLEAIPKSIGYWSVLRLDLHGNKFRELPDSMCELSNLKDLTLANCIFLQALPKLPLSLERLDLHGNKFRELPDSMYELSNLKDLILAYCTFLLTLPKLPLNLKNLCLQGCILLPTNDSSALVTYVGFGCQPHKILDLHEEQSPKLLGKCWPMLGLEIPDWFFYRSIGSNKTIRIHMDGHDSPQLCALLIVYEVHRNDKSKSRKRKFDETENSNISACEGDDSISPEFVCQFQHEELSPERTIIRVPEVAHIGTHGVCVLIDFSYFWREWKFGKRWSCLALITASSENVKLKECAVLPLYWFSIFKFDEAVSKISQLRLDSNGLSHFSPRLCVTGP